MDFISQHIEGSSGNSVLNEELSYITDIFVVCYRAMLAMDRLLRDLHMKVVPVVDVIPSVSYDQLQSLREAFHQFIYVFPSARLDCFLFLSNLALR